MFGARSDFGAQVEWVGLRVFTPLSVIALVFGILMAVDDRWEFGQMWIQLGLGGWFLSFLLGAGFLGPQSGKLGRLIREHGAEHPEVRPRLQRLLLVARLDMLPERFETRADDRPDIRSEDERDRDAVSSWMRWQGALQALGAHDASLIIRASRQTCGALVIGGRLSTTGSVFVAAMRSMRQVVDRG